MDNPLQSSSVEERSANGAAQTTTGLTPALGAGIAAAFPIVGSLIFLLLEKKDAFTRFWAMQSLFFGIAWIVVPSVMHFMGMIFGKIPFLGGIIAFFIGLLILFVSLAFVVLWIVNMVKAFSGVQWEIPYLGAFARKQLEKMPV